MTAAPSRYATQGCALGEPILIARQPILDAQGRLVAYELLFRGDFDAKFNHSNGQALTMSVVADLLGQLGLDGISDGKPCYLNCPDEFLCSPTIKLLPPERFVLEILETSSFSPKVHAACAQLRQQGFRLALDDITELSDAVVGILPLIDIAKIDWKDTPVEARQRLCQALGRHGLIVLAEKVENWSDYRAALAAGASLFQGYYFSRPETISARRVSPSTRTLLEVMQLLLDDAHHRQIASALLKAPSLLAQLLRLCSSAALPGAKGSAIASVEDALRLVGNTQLMRWCGLLLYLDRMPAEDDPLSYLAAQRSRVMGEYIQARHPQDDGLKRQAEMAGSLSLLHVAYACDAGTFWQEIALNQAIREAILEQRGPLGEALAAAGQAETSF